MIEDSKIGTIVAQGEPVAMGRPRFTKGGRVYTPKKTEEALQVLSSYAQEQIEERGLDCNIAVTMKFFFKRPKRLKKGPRVLKGTKPDLDNLVKLVLDGLNRSGIWVDDNQVTFFWAHKFYCSSDEEPRTEIALYKEDPAQ
jgi:Holliday junction resolvase RusA-like endonuclease